MKLDSRAAPLAIPLLMSLLLVAPPASAEDGPAGPERRVLGGHRFLPSSVLSDPFLTTHVSTRTAAGLAGDFKSPFFDVNGDTIGTLEGDLAFFGLEFEYQQNLFHWAALRLNVSGSGRAGVDEQSLLADGVNTVYGAVLEGKARIWRRDKALVTGLARLSRKNIFGISPFEFAQSVVDSGLNEDNHLVTEGNLLRLTGGLAGAYAPAPWVGLTAQVYVGTAQPFDDTLPNETVFQTAVSGSFDLRPGAGVPIGFLVSYDYDSFPEGGSDVAKGINRFGLGTFYTGRDDFNIGLDVSVSSFKQLDVEETFSATAAALYLRYYF